MEQKLLKLTAQVGFLALLMYVGASVVGKRDELKLHRHPKDRRQNPDSPVWQHSNVRGPLASPINAVAVRG